MAHPLSTLGDQARRDDAFREGHRMCPSCSEATALHAIGRATDNGRKTVLTLGTFCSEASTVHFPNVIAWGRGSEEPASLGKTLAVLQAPADSAASVAEGVRDAADMLSSLGAWSATAPNVVAVISDIGAVAGGLDAVLHVMHRGRRIALFVLLHEVYGASHFPVPATSLASATEPMDHLGLAVAAGAGYVAQVSPAFPELFAQVADAALACDSSAVVFVPAPCVSGWRIDEGQVATLARLACETGLAPCFRKRRGERGEILHVPEKPKRPGVEEYLARQMRFDPLVRLRDGRPMIVPGREGEVAAIQNRADGLVAHLEAIVREPSPGR